MSRYGVALLMTLLRSLLRPGVVALACLVVGLPVAARLVAGPPGAIVHVRWQVALNESARHRLEAHYRLADGAHLDGTTWRYDLLDTSAHNLRELVGDPAVDDTAHIDRAHSTLSDTDPTGRRLRVPFGSSLVTVADRTSTLACGIGALWLFVLAIARAGAGAEELVSACAGFTILALAVYAQALWFPPTDGDDLGYLSSVATIGNPLRYFVQDHGHGNNLYRPLTPLSIWGVYQLFGVWAFPNQLVNLLLHLLNVGLFYRIVRRAQPDRSLAFVVSAVFMVSQYTYTSATWVSDRPMLLTGFALLLLVDHLSTRMGEVQGQRADPISIPAVLAFAVLALLSKESGVVVPGVALLVSLSPVPVTRLTRRGRIQLATVSIVVVVAYLLLRRLIFGSAAASYSQDGFMFFGLRHYDDSHELSQVLMAMNFAENVLKNMLAPILPIFGDRGDLVPWEWLQAGWLIVAPTALLFLLAAKRPLTRLQLIAVMIVVASAAAHYALFRFRLQYLSQAAFCLFLGGARFDRGSQEETWRTLMGSKVLAAVLVAASVLLTSNILDKTMVDHRRGLERRQNLVERYGQIGRQVVERYR